MSHITDMVLLTNEGPESEIIKRLNAWCREHGDNQAFERITATNAGGRKVFCTNVYACAGNFFPWRDLLGAFRTFFGSDAAGKYAAETTVLILQDEDHEHWIAVHGDGASVPESEAALARGYFHREPKKETGYVIRIGAGAFWRASYGMWTDRLDDATIYYGHAGELAIKPLVGGGVALVKYTDAKGGS